MLASGDKSKIVKLECYQMGLKLRCVDGKHNVSYSNRHSDRNDIA